MLGNARKIPSDVLAPGTKENDKMMQLCQWEQRQPDSAIALHGLFFIKMYIHTIASL